MTRCILENGPEMEQESPAPRVKLTYFSPDGVAVERTWELAMWDYETDSAHYRFVSELDITDEMEKSQDALRRYAAGISREARK